MDVDALGSVGFQDGLDHVCTWFEALTDAEKTTVFAALMERIKDNTSLISSVSQTIDPYTRVDFMSRLPDKLAKHILSFCDARSLTLCAQVSRRWRELANDDTLWHRMCAQHINRKCKKCGWGLPLVAADGPEGEGDDGLHPVKRRRRSWKDIYAERMRVECNWRNGHFQVRKLTGHTEGVLCLEFNEHRIVSGGYDRTIRVWDMKTGKCERVIVGHEDSVRCLQFDKVKIISGSLDGTVRIWCLETGECVREMQAHKGGAMSLQFDDTRLASGGADSNIRIWTYDDGKCHVLRGHTDVVNCVRLHSGKLLSASDDSTLRVWDLATLTCVTVLEGHNAEVPCAQLSHNTILSGSMDNTIKIWNLQTGKCVDTLFGHTGGVWFVQFDNLRIVSGSQDGTIKIWDLQSGRCMHTLKGVAPVNVLQFNDTRIVSGSDDNSIKIWDFGVDA